MLTHEAFPHLKDVDLKEIWHMLVNFLRSRGREDLLAQHIENSKKITYAASTETQGDSPIVELRGSRNFIEQLNRNMMQDLIHSAEDNGFTPLSERFYYQITFTSILGSLKKCNMDGLKPIIEKMEAYLESNFDDVIDIPGISLSTFSINPLPYGLDEWLFGMLSILETFIIQPEVDVWIKDLDESMCNKSLRMTD